MKTLLVATIKDEGPNILEWVAYHRVIGFDQIAVYQNDSTDFTMETLSLLQDLGAILWYDNPSGQNRWQNKAYNRTSTSEEFATADWCMALDGDEFLNVKIGEGRVQDLIAACSAYDEVFVNWRNFGCSGHRALSPDPVIGRYLLTDPPDAIERRPMGFKSLFNTKAFGKPGIHRAKKPFTETPARCNGSGLPVEGLGKVTWRSRDPGLWALAQVNHYPIRDLSSFLVKTTRGSASHPDRDVGLRYWKSFNRTTCVDGSILKWLLPTLTEMHRLNDASGGALFDLKDDALQVWEEKLAVGLLLPGMPGLVDDLITDIAQRFGSAKT